MRRLGLYLFIAASAISPTGARAQAAAAGARPAFARLRAGVRDLPGAAAWFQRALAWSPAYASETRVLFSSATAPLELDASPADSTATLVLSVADADAAYQKLVELGAVSVEAPSDRPSGFREAYVRGPGALTIELDGPLAAQPDFVFTELAAGSGASPGPDDTVKVRYFGTLADGKVFDGAHRSGRALMIPLGSAIRCWSQALTRMKPGGRARFVCPPALAYGRKGRSPDVPPDAALTFEVELVGVVR